MTTRSSQYARFILALDTSSDYMAVAVASIPNASEGVALDVQPADLSVLAAGDHPCRRRSNVELISTCLEVLKQADLSMDDIDAVVVGRGPGSFTGVRIGIATAKGLACGQECPLFGASTLDAVAWTAHAAGVRGKLVVVDDAMRHEVYPGLYQLDEAGATRCFETESVQAVDVCVDTLAARSDASDLQLVGNGLAKYRDQFEAAGLHILADEELWLPTSAGLLRAWCAAGPHAPAAGDPALVLPIYTRLSDAEENERLRLGQQAPRAVPTGVNEALATHHLQLRPMSVSDVEQVAALEARAYAEAAHTPWTQQLFLDEFEQPGRTWWVAHDAEKVVGFAGGVLAGSDVELVDVVVDEAYRKRGIAQRLVARVAYDAHVLNAEKLTLEVEADNAAGQALYRSLGLQEVGRRPGYYSSGHDALIMQAALPLANVQRPLDELPEPRGSRWQVGLAERTHTAADATRIAEAADLLLAIESSCDETAMAVIDGAGTILSSVVATQIDFHARFGGVVPEIASRKHTEALVGVYEEALEQAATALGVSYLDAHDLAGVAVTKGPGLVGALVVGIAFAKGLAASAGLELIGINHLEGHLMANLFERPDLEPPFVASLVSGGNTMLVYVRAWGNYEVLGTTIDDAVGEAFDKVAKALGLGYPGGPTISRLAHEGNPKAIHFPRALLHEHGLDFSLSGLKTSVITYIEKEQAAGRPLNLPDLCASFEAAVIDVQVAKAVRAVEQTGVSDFCVGGGVAANAELRAAYQKAMDKRGVRLTVPALEFCGDNAAMIALAARRRFDAGERADFSLDAEPNLQLGA